MKPIYEIETILRCLGITRCYKGYYYIKEAVHLVVEDELRMDSITKEVYMEIATRHRCKWTAVERDLRTVVARAWEVNAPLLQRMALYPLDRVPTAAEFVEIMAAHVLRGTWKIEDELNAAWEALEMPKFRMDFLELSKSRYSVLFYQEKCIPDSFVEKILEAGMSAPTACNFQPQRIKLINSDEDRAKLNKVVPSKYYVPAAFLVCYDKTKCWKRKFDGKFSGEIDASIVTTHMLMEATSLGLGSIWVMHWNPETMKDEFDIPEQFEPVALLIVGYADTTIEPHKEHYIRKGIKDVLF